MKTRMNRKRIAVVVASAAVATAGTVGVAGAMSGDDDARDRPIPTPQLKRAEQAALAETGGGTVSETEVDDEESKYEVEVTLEDGTHVDVQLDADFQVVSSDDDGADDESGESEGDSD